MQESGTKEIRESTKPHLRKKLKTEFKSLLQFEDLLGNNRLFVVHENLSQIRYHSNEERIKILRTYSIHRSYL